MNRRGISLAKDKSQVSPGIFRNSRCSENSSSKSSLNRSKSSNTSSSSNNSSQLFFSVTNSKSKDPFRKAPFYANAQMLPKKKNTMKSTLASSSSSSSLSSISIHSSPKLITNIASETGTIGCSAFQPYKRQPDPFVSAPFDHIPRDLLNAKADECSPTSSITPTDLLFLSNKSSKPKACNLYFFRNFDSVYHVNLL
jgi:hypothetical protein